MDNIANGLTLTKTKSMAKVGLIFDDLESIKQYIKDQSDVIVYLDNEVLIGQYNGNFSFYGNKTIDKQFVKRMRIFNQNEELYLWRDKGKLIGRYRKDSEGEEIDFIEANQVIYGTKAEYEDGCTILTEQRGTKIVLPGKWKANNKKSRVAIKTKHYIGYQDSCQATYIDARFVKFIQLPEGG